MSEKFVEKDIYLTTIQCIKEYINYLEHRIAQVETNDRGTKIYCNELINDLIVSYKWCKIRLKICFILILATLTVNLITAWYVLEALK